MYWKPKDTRKINLNEMQKNTETWTATKFTLCYKIIPTELKFSKRMCWTFILRKGEGKKGRKEEKRKEGRNEVKREDRKEGRKQKRTK